jgi:NAD(P)-dependent dehydrogenase (short-subunit alcohol dehydrogenase family)
MTEGVCKQKGLLADQVAVVTGGTMGIGRATCLALAREGAHAVVVGRNRDRLEETLAALTQQEFGPEPLGLALDVRREADMEEMVRRVLDRFQRIDILVTAAAVLRGQEGYMRTLQQMSVQEWDAVVDTNLKGVFLTNRAVLPAMIHQGRGNIINVSSTSGRKGLAYDSAYCASKFGVIGLSETLAEEMRQYGIRVQVVLPGAIETGMWDQNPLPRPKDILSVERVADFIVRLVTLPEDMAITAPIIEPLKTQLSTGWKFDPRTST